MLAPALLALCTLAPWSALLSARSVTALPVLTEIMADPTPAQQLPAVEYLELYNPSGRPIHLAEVELWVDNRGRPLPAYHLPPGAYVLLCHQRDTAALQPYGAVTGLAGFPRLRNTGATISLKHTTTGESSRITYSDTWYGNPAYRQGGYSLESTRRDRSADCSAAWTASRDPSGGSPGRRNSVAGLQLDQTPPRLQSAALTPTALLLTFDEMPDTNGLRSPSWLALEPPLGLLPAVISTENPQLVFPLMARPDSQQLYRLSVFPDYTDCVGNAAERTLTFDLALPGHPQPNDVVINELLYDPTTGAVDFIEILNRSKRILQLDAWQWRHRSHLSGARSERVLPSQRLLLPGELRVFCADTAILRRFYPAARADYLQEGPIPVLPRSGGHLSLYSPDGQLIDALSYSDSLHDPLLATTRGVSLERIDADAPAALQRNWYSSAHGATPTRPNSLAGLRLPIRQRGSTLFRLTTPTFSPDGDGFEDQLVMPYDNPSPGLRADIMIFDLAGRAVRTLAQQLLLDGRGQVRWAGQDDQGRAAPHGVYLIVIDLFHPDGLIRSEKYSCVLAREL